MDGPGTSPDSSEPLDVLEAIATTRAIRRIRPDPVSDDDLSAVSPYLGVALPLVDTRRVRLGLALKAGVSFYGRHTDAGLRNDLFPTTGFARLQIETAFPL